MHQRHIWIVAATTFTLLCLAGVGATVYRDYEATLSTIVSETRARARLMAAHAEQGLVSSAAALDRAAQILPEFDPNVPASVEAARVRLSDLVTGSTAATTMWAISPDARTWVNNNSATPSRRDVSDRIYFTAQVTEPDKLHVGPTEVGTVVKRPRFTMSRTIFAPDGSFGGVVVAGIDTVFLEDIYRRVRQTENVVLLAFNGDGDPLATAPTMEPPEIDRARVAIPPGKDAASAATADGWFYASAAVPSLPIVLVAGTNLRAALADWQWRALRLGIIGLLMVAGFWALTIQGLRAVRREELAAKELVAANEHLEARVKERTRTVELLFRELNHRVKNNLQIVASLLRLQMRKTDDAGARTVLQDSISRIFAIADVHGEMEQVQEGEVALRAYVGKIVGRICDAMQKPDQQIEVNLDIADATLGLDRAVLLAIAINETVTNAFKHAFADRSSGRLDIVVTVEDGMLQLAIRNDLPAEPRPEHDGTTMTTGRSGLGTSIINMMVQQMSGSIAVDDTDGYGVKIRVPLR